MSFPPLHLRTDCSFIVFRLFNRRQNRKKLGEKGLFLEIYYLEGG